MRLPAAVLASLALAVPMMSVAASGPSHPETKITTEKVTTERRGPIVGIMPMADLDEQAAIQEQQAIQSYLAALEEQRKVDEYLAQLAAEEAARQEAARQVTNAQRAARPQYPAAPINVTGACGGATNGADQYIGRESGGDPSIMNGGGHAASPFDAGRAWGCYQIMPGTWAGSCSDITT